MTSIFLRTLLLASILFQAPVFAEDKIWIAIEGIVAKSLKAEKFPPVFIHSQRETPTHLEALVFEKDLSKLSHYVHHKFNRCGGFRVLELGLEKFKRQKKGLLKQSTLLTDYSINQNEQVESWIQNISQENMEDFITHFSSYKTRYYKAPEGVEAMKWLGEKWRTMTAARNDVNLEYYDHKKYPQPSVILTFLGENRTADDLGPVIILGGHGDSINTDDEGIHSHAPGADDNAAGMAVLTEIIRLMVLHNYAPKHTIQFISYAAEEVGIQGSYHLARVYRERRQEVMGVIQFDGVNYKGPSYDMSLVGDNTNKDQNTFVAGLIDTYLKATWRYEYCGYACSDHAAWNYEGYPASYPVEGIASEQNPYFHTAKDTFDKSGNSAEHATLFTKLGLAYLIELDR